jgi:DMSO/TMAO reductase YedYZ molybdopterin-dependent catalytic subunit
MPMRQDFSKYQEGDPPGTESVGSNVIVSPDTLRDQRLPPGQVRTRKWPVLHWKRVPNISLDDWTFFVRGLVAHPLLFNWREFRSLPRVQVFADFHCVTRWSRLGNVWEGVSVREILTRAEIRPEGKFVVAHGYDDGFTTNLPLSALTAADALLCDAHDGEPLSSDHGGPLRLIVPRLYAWKSAKWLAGLEVVPEDSPGLWERNGYHNDADPWREQRHSW